MRLSKHLWTETRNDGAFQRVLKVISFAALLVFASLVHADIGAIDIVPMIESARSQIGVTRSYDPAYRVLAYPNGDVPLDTGVCTDVITRALRAQKIDLQKLVHEDMRGNFSHYPQRWGLKRADTNIDHRRVPNLMTFFTRNKAQLSISNHAIDYAPGDIVAWDLGRGITHIGVVSDRKTFLRTPLIIHNIGRGTQEENILFRYKIIGHYRLKPHG
jgi:uncharacterized protein